MSGGQTTRHIYVNLKSGRRVVEAGTKLLCLTHKGWKFNYMQWAKKNWALFNGQLLSIERGS